ncbi:hypothetical protein GLOIN_2v1840613 [Rhizophagus irregularis DAOM 181602=DAOM 197198]|nr:hypothetical protein GLOIN_2v1840613 [Rhizophagus irregularis DAOM 181602=DAOM 197198]
MSPEPTSQQRFPECLCSVFLKDVRHKNAHRIAENNKGRWCDLSLQRLTVVHLTCEVVTCLGSAIRSFVMILQKYFGLFTFNGQKRVKE